METLTIAELDALRRAYPSSDYRSLAALSAATGVSIGGLRRLLPKRTPTTVQPWTARRLREFLACPPRGKPPRGKPPRGKPHRGKPHQGKPQRGGRGA